MRGISKTGSKLKCGCSMGAVWVQEPYFARKAKKKAQPISAKPLILMARPERFELPTTWFVARYSIQLSYGRVKERAFCAFALILSTRNMAEREGFEPSIEFPLYALSRGAPSATRPSLQNSSAYVRSANGPSGHAGARVIRDSRPSPLRGRLRFRVAVQAGLRPT